MTGKYNVDDSDKGRHNTILGRYLLSELGLNLKFPNTSLKYTIEILKDLQHPIFISVCIHLNTEIQEKLNLKNRLHTLTPKHYINHNMYLLQINYCAYF